MEEVIKLSNKGDKAMTNGFFSKVKPEKALSYFEDAYKTLRKLKSNNETRNVQIDLLEKLANCEHLLEMNYNAGKRLEEAARLVVLCDGERLRTAVPMLVRSADSYKTARNYFKACSVMVRACKLLEEQDDTEELANLVEKVVVTCEEESFPQFRDILDQTISLLVRMENFEKAREIVYRERALFTVNKLK